MTAGASVASSVINTVNTIIGSGVLVLPYTFRAQGILLGTVVLILAGLANGFGMILQGAAAQFLPPGTATFFSVCRITYPRLSVVFDLAIFLQCFGVDISYLVLISDLLPLVYSFEGWAKQDMNTFYLFASAIVVVPLCFMRRLDSLKYTSVVALAAIVYLAMLIYGNFAYAWATGWKHIPSDKLGGISLVKPEGVRPFLKTLGIVVLAYTCPNQFSIIAELARPTVDRVAYIAYVSLGITVVIFFSVALSGYLTFGNALEGNILLMYENGVYTQMGRVLLVLMVALSYPLMFHPARISFNNVVHTLEVEFWGKGSDGGSSDSTSGTGDDFECGHPLTNEMSPLFEGAVDEDHSVPFSTLRFHLFTVFLLLVSYASAFYLNSFELILAIVGCTGGVLICFVLPGCYGYKLIDNADYVWRLEQHSPTEANHWIFRAAWVKKTCLVLVFWGLAVMAVCLYSLVF